MFFYAMGFTRHLTYFLVHTAKLTNKAAKEAIAQGKVTLNDALVTNNCVLTGHEKIQLNGLVLQAKTHFRYWKFYKPIGYQSSLNQNVPNNLHSFFDASQQLAIAGRLDKASEGLLLLSNNGKWIETLCHPHFEKEKEYLVQVNATFNQTFIEQLCKGIRFWNYTTKPCQAEQLDPYRFRICLTEGKNRQIRNMCHHLGYSVTSLLRTRIHQWELGSLQPGELEEFTV